MGGYHKPYRSRPPANRPAARFAWDWFVEDEVEAGRNREPKSMIYTHMDYWVWAMEFTNGDFEEKDALECQHSTGGRGFKSRIRPATSPRPPSPA